MNDSNATRINPESGFLAAILSKSGRAIAADAAWRLLEHEPFAKEGFGTDPFSGWQHWLAARVEELASAIALGHPEIFVDQVLRHGQRLARGALIQPTFARDSFIFAAFFWKNFRKRCRP